MLEIIFLIFFSKKIREATTSKGYNKTPYIILAIALWFTFEIVGGIIGFIVFQDNIFAAFICALTGAGISALLTWSIVKSLKNKNSEENNNLIQR